MVGNRTVWRSSCQQGEGGIDIVHHDDLRQRIRRDVGGEGERRRLEHRRQVRCRMPTQRSDHQRQRLVHSFGEPGDASRFFRTAYVQRNHHHGRGRNSVRGEVHRQLVEQVDTRFRHD
jgi:hypothetical protein